MWTEDLNISGIKLRFNLSDVEWMGLKRARELR